MLVDWLRLFVPDSKGQKMAAVASKYKPNVGTVLVHVHSAAMASLGSLPARHPWTSET